MAARRPRQSALAQTARTLPQGCSINGSNSMAMLGVKARKLAAVMLIAGTAQLAAVGKDCA